jgi:ankyrin repeat protein
MPTRSLPEKPSFENLRKQAKALRRSVLAEEPTAVNTVREFHPGGAERLAEFSLSDAQLVIARSYGFASWAKLKDRVSVIEAYAWLPPAEASAEDAIGSPVERLIDLACLNYGYDWTTRREKARELFAADPSLGKANIYTAATVGDIEAVQRMLAQEPSLAKQRGGVRNWEPLLYACYSRFNSTLPGYSTLAVARLLLQHGADSNAAFLWESNYLFTALTGAFGEGERGPVNQPQHQYCYELARLLLENGADPNDSQALYNRMFRPDDRHLELLFEFGLGQRDDGVWFQRLGNRIQTPARMLNDQVAWAVKEGFRERVELLVAHQVDLDSADNRFHRSPYELARLSGRNEIADYLKVHGAKPIELTPIDAFAVSCILADKGKARSLLAEHPKLLEFMVHRRVELLQRAAATDNPAAIKLMSELGFDLNERQRTTALHDASSSGHLEMVKLLVELGADPLILDTEFNARPFGWANYGAQYSDHPEQCRAVMEYLAQFEPA